MNDLVARLRQPLMLHANPEQTNAERGEAADAIDRLTKALKTSLPILSAVAGGVLTPQAVAMEVYRGVKATLTAGQQQNEGGG